MSQTGAEAGPASILGSAMKVLVREPIAPAGIDLLRERFDVDVDSSPTSTSGSPTTTR